MVLRTGAWDAEALRRLKNEIIGSRVSKVKLANGGELAGITALLVAPHATREERILAANILGSIAQNATPTTLLAVLQCDAPFFLLICLGSCATEARHMQDPAEAAVLGRYLEGIVRALRAIMCSISGQISYSSRWGLGNEWGYVSMMDIKSEGLPDAIHLPEKLDEQPMEQDAPQNVAGSSVVKIRQAIAAAWMPSVPESAWIHRHEDESRGERATKAAKTRKDEDHAPSMAAPPPDAPYAEYVAMCASLDEAEALSDCDAYATLTWLCRSTVSTLFDQKSLFLLLGTLMVASDTLGDRSKLKSYSSSDLPTLAVSRIVLGRAQAFSIIGAVCEILGACFTINGIENYTSSPVGTRLRFSHCKTHQPTSKTSHADDIARRYHCFLRFAPWDNPFRADESTLSPTLEAPGYTAIVALLGAAESSSPRVQEAALWLLHGLLTSCSDIGIATVLELYSTHGTKFVPAIKNLATQSRSASVRLVAYSCFVELVGSTHAPVSGAWLMQGIVAMLETPGDIQLQACFALARLVRCRPELQLLAAEKYSVCERLSRILDRTRSLLKSSLVATDQRPLRRVDESVVRLHESCLTALGILATQSDLVRRRILACSPWLLESVVIPSLSSRAVGIQIAACRLVRALSRTISILRTIFMDADMAEHMFALLESHPPGFLQAEALGALCNMLVKYSPLKKDALQQDRIQIVTRHAHCLYGPVRFNALWAIKNAVWDSDSATKRRVIDTFGWRHLASITASSDSCIQEQALGIIRNLTASHTEEAVCEDIEMTLSGIGEDHLLGVIEGVVWSLHNDPATEQAAFILSNIAAGSDRHRALITDRPNLVDAICSFLQHRRESVREAGVQCGFNLGYCKAESRHEDDTVQHRAVTRLCAFGFNDRLKALEKDPDRNVRNRVRDVLTRI
ncbi:hypothetical protein MYAM1_000432 [Malassezia yamatoensis]|uniref:Armadillo repeat-containing protein 8 n=1 Tax=Malassezia yamatoensis TaxID=253288 RepID=A0AAJ5YNR4_9BASI|nr:hypothetical protein MYAM1_000432 [Malassezia yamatoensis]